MFISAQYEKNFLIGFPFPLDTKTSPLWGPYALKQNNVLNRDCRKTEICNGPIFTKLNKAGAFLSFVNVGLMMAYSGRK
jgi:hypothetical protein